MDRQKTVRETLVTMPRAILLGSVLIAAAVAVMFRWEVEHGLLLDRWTGRVLTCAAPSEAETMIYKSAGFSDKEIAEYVSRPCR